METGRFRKGNIWKRTILKTKKGGASLKRRNTEKLTNQNWNNLKKDRAQNEHSGKGNL